jgi:lysozyme family protein
VGNFDISVALTLVNEGGFQKIPSDKGNWTGGQVNVGELKGTKYGISASQFPTEDIENLTVDRAKELYFTSPKEFWNPLYEQIKDQFVCNKVFDVGVLFGPPRAVKDLQEILQPQFPEVVPDMQFGQRTLAAVNASEPVSLLVAYKTRLVANAIQAASNNPNERSFISSWIRRINS